MTLDYDDIDKRKFRHMVDIFYKTHEFDYTKTFSPVDKATTVCLVLSIVVHFSWDAK